MYNINNNNNNNKMTKVEIDYDYLGVDQVTGTPSIGRLIVFQKNGKNTNKL